MANELQMFRGDPFLAVQDHANRVLREILAASTGQQGQRNQGSGQILPPAEAIDEENAYRITLEVPGVEPRDVDVSVIGNTLSIKAERRRHNQQEGQGQQGQGQQGQQGSQPGQQGGQQEQQRARHVLFTEIQHGIIRREFGLPEDADRNRINAEFRNGLLTLTIPKSQEVHQRRRIEIKTT